jgi:Uma2 family endonuclease
MTAPHHKFYTSTEYLEREVMAEYKSEYRSGAIYEMAHESVAHNRITLNASTSLDQKLEDSLCEVFVLAMRLCITDEFCTYPDVMVVCGELQYIAEREDTITNPIVIVEVLSESTADYDRGEKFRRYRQIPTLQEYVLIEQTSVHVECYRKSDEQNGYWKQWNHWKNH